MGDQVDAEAFSNELAELKRGGCNVLVSSDAAGREEACERLLGAPELDRRHVFVTTGAGVSSVLERHRPRRTDAGSFAVVDATPDTRGAAAASPSEGTGPSMEGTEPSMEGAGPTLEGADDWYARVEDPTDYGALFETVRRALDRVATDSDGPGEVRLCLDGLDPLLDAVEAGETDEEELFRFLHMLAGAVRDVDGMGHVHVSESVADGVLGTFEPLFDATLTIRTTATGDARQRWRLHDSDRVTGWFQF